MAGRRLPALVWSARGHRSRVLVEADDESRRTATEQTLGAAGYEVLSCAGPDTVHLEECPAVVGDRCHGAAHADVVVCDLDLTDAHLRAIPAAVSRELRAGASVIVLTDKGEADRYRDELAGCRLLESPVGVSELLQEVAAALDHLAETPQSRPLRPPLQPPGHRR